MESDLPTPSVRLFAREASVIMPTLNVDADILGEEINVHQPNPRYLLFS
jgi:hypothetical protein